MSSPLKELLSKAAEILGEPVDSLVVNCTGGSRVRVVKAVEQAPEKQIDSRIRNLIPKIEGYVRSHDIPLARKQIAMGLEKEAGKPIKGDTSGTFGKTILYMIETGLLSEDDDRMVSWIGPDQNSRDTSKNDATR